MVRVARFLCPSVEKWTPSLLYTLPSSRNRSEMLDVVGQEVTQQESITLKLETPRLTRCFMRSFFRWTKPERSTSEKSLSFALVQWFISPQHREKRYLGNGGNTMHGFAFSIGVMFSTIFLKVSGGVTTTFPAKWNLLLLKGRAVVPSNCSKRTELLPSKSNTKAIES
jgi:hypothetical protein